MKKAFTLIELLVVVLIIGILASIALPQYQKTVEKSHVAEAKIMLKALSDAQDVWVLESGGGEFGGTYNFNDLNYAPSGTHTVDGNGRSHITTRYWDIYLDECGVCGNNAGGCCCDMYADRIGKDYSIELVGSNYDGGGTPGVFYCYGENNVCQLAGAIKNSSNDWIF